MATPPGKPNIHLRIAAFPQPLAHLASPLHNKSGSAENSRRIQDEERRTSIFFHCG